MNFEFQLLKKSFAFKLTIFPLLSIISNRFQKQLVFSNTNVSTLFVLKRFEEKCYGLQLHIIVPFNT